VAEVGFGVLEVLQGGDGVAVQLWGEVVVDILGWVLPLGLGGGGTDLEFVSDHTLGDFEIIEVIVDVLVSAEVWNWIVNLVASLLLLVLVLSAAS